MKATPGGSEADERRQARKYSSMHVCMEALECAHSRNGDGGGMEAGDAEEEEAASKVLFTC